MSNVIQFKRKQPAPKLEAYAWETVTDKVDDKELDERIQRIRNSIKRINTLMEQLRSMRKEDK